MRIGDQIGDRSVHARLADAGLTRRGRKQFRVGARRAEDAGDLAVAHAHEAGYVKPVHESGTDEADAERSFRHVTHLRAADRTFVSRLEAW